MSIQPGSPPTAHALSRGVTCQAPETCMASPIFAPLAAARRFHHKCPLGGKRETKRLKSSFTQGNPPKGASKVERSWKRNRPPGMNSTAHRRTCDSPGSPRLQPLDQIRRHIRVLHLRRTGMHQPAGHAAHLLLAECCGMNSAPLYTAISALMLGCGS